MKPPSDEETKKTLEYERGYLEKESGQEEPD